MAEQRPDPDLLLKKIAQETDNQNNQQGSLKVFFGYAAGVGKTFAMLQAAHEAKAAGIDVVVGYIEPHTRPETIALLEGLEILPVLEVEYKNIVLKEFDIDAAIKRKPQLILVDELAHSNAEGCRHIKRFQDIEELINAGIDVYTTVNVQHIESLNDIVASITGVIVRERIPDSVFDSADQIKLVDIEPSDLLNRLTQGKIYRQQQATRAMSNFFTQDNLASLREIALRRTADRVYKVAEKRKTHTQKNDYFTSEHILICLSGSPSNAKVIRTAGRMVEAFHGSFTALFVETSTSKEQPEEDRKRLQDNLKLAEQLGAKIITVYGDDIPYQIAEYAKASGISKIVIGRSNNKKGFFLQQQSFMDRLTELAPNLDIYIIPDNRRAFSPKKSLNFLNKEFSWIDNLKTLAIMIVATAIGFALEYLGLSEANIVTVYILGVLFISSSTSGKFYGVISSVLGVLLYNFFFTYPYYTFNAFGDNYPVVTFTVMFFASILTSSLTRKRKTQADQASIKAYRTEILLETSQKLQRAINAEEIINEAAQQMRKLLDRDIVFYAVDKNKLSEPRLCVKNNIEENTEKYISADEQAVAHWVYKNKHYAGATTNTLPSAKCLYMAVRNNETVFAVFGIVMEEDEIIEPFEKNLLMSMLAECALAFEKEAATKIKNQIELEVRQEQLRANLLRAISHDLRTPLTSISGNANLLMQHSEELDATKKHFLYTDIYDDSMWLINLVENLLSVTRIENGTMNLKMQPELIQEVINETLFYLNRKKSEHIIEVELQDELLMAEMDVRLIIQVIINIVDNAIKYTQEGSLIKIYARHKGDMVEVSIADNGKGIDDKDKEKIFQMFFTAADMPNVDARRGLGLGLSLCKSIVEAHGGTIAVKDNQPQGTIFSFTLRNKEVNINE